MKTHQCILVCLLAVMLCACDATTREARRMVKRAEQLADTLPDSTVRLIDSVLRMPASFSERERMDMALLQAEALFGDRGQEILPVMDDDFFDEHANLSTSPELERAAVYYAGKKQYPKAAHAALYSGFVQQHYNEKEAAMRSFKEAEKYGKQAVDSLTVAQAEYRIGKMLYYEGLELEALNVLRSAYLNFGVRLGDKAFVQNMMAVCYILQKDYDNSYHCLEQSLKLSEASCSNKAKRKTLNNFAVFYRVQGNHNQAIDYLRLVANDQNMLETEKPLLYLNLGKAFMAQGQIDSALIYYQHLEELLPHIDVINETKISAYGALSRFSDSQGDEKKALHYREIHEDLLFELMIHRQEQSVYRIQKQFDYESLQNEMNRKLIRKQRFITIIGIFAIVGLVTLTVSQIRLARMRKQEAEAKTNLFHFMQQNKELVQKNESSEKALADLSIMHKADEKAYQDLIQKNSEIESACNAYAQQLSDALNKEALTMRKFDIYLKNKGDLAYLAALKDAVFNNEDHWEALMGVFDSLYPNVRSNLVLQHPELTEMEQKDFILSYFNVSRDEEALLFQKSVHTVDKVRYAVRQKMKKSGN